MKRMFTTVVGAGLLAAPALADVPRVGITADMASVTVQTPQGPVEISRDQTEGAMIEGEWAVTNRNCPPFCIQPISPAEGTRSVGELELLEAVSAGEAILVDSRTPDWFTGGTISARSTSPIRRRSSVWPS